MTQTALAGRHSMESPAEKPLDWTTDDWATPPEIVAELAREFGPFDLDVCCRPETAKAPRFYTKAENGLVQPWNGTVWLNPPYSDPTPWLREAVARTYSGECPLVVALLPASTDTGWFHNYVWRIAEVRFRKGRIKFHDWTGGPKGMPKGGNIVAIYHGRCLACGRC